MKIGIDLRCLMAGRQSGVEEFALQLVRHLLKIDQDNRYVFFFNSSSQIKFDFSQLPSGPNVEIIRTRWPNKLLNFLMWYLGWPTLDHLMGDPDLVYSPNLNFGRVSSHCRTIQTAHDLSFEHYPDTFSLKSRLWHFFVSPRRICRRAGRIAVGSSSTGDDLIESYQLPTDKITIIPYAIDPAYRIKDRNDIRMVEVARQYALPYKFIFFLGTLEYRKNLPALIRAYARFRHSGNPEFQKFKLVLAGNPGQGFSDIRRAIADAGLEKDVVVTGPVAEADKVYLYNLASLFVYPSLYEGFGFPVLEAMACGVPVITSNVSSMPEVSGEAAILIDPERPDEIFQAMRQILGDKDLSARLVKTGLEQVKHFDWNKTAQGYLALFQQTTND